MRLLNLWNIYVNSSLHWAVAASIFAYIFTFLLQTTLSLPYYLVVFSIFFFTATFNRYTDKEEDKINAPERLAIIKKIENMAIFFSLLLLLASFVFLMSNNKPEAALVLFVAVGIAYVYSKRLGPLKRLKEITFIKNASIAFIFVLTAVIIPFLVTSSASVAALVLASAYLFLRLVVNTIVFDLRDIVGDKRTGIHTLPVKIGEKRTVLLTNIINILSGIVIVYGGFFGIFPSPVFIIISLSALAAAFYINFYNKTKISKTIYYELLVDGSDTYFIAAILLLSSLVM